MHPPKIRMAESPDLGPMWYLVDENYNLIPEVLKFLNFQVTAAQLAPATRKRSCERLRWLYHYLWLRGLDIHEVTTEQFTDFSAWLSNPHRDTGLATETCTHTLCTSTYNSIITTVAALFRFMQDRGLITHSPVPYRWKQVGSSQMKEKHIHIPLIPREKPVMELRHMEAERMAQFISRQDFDRFLDTIYPNNDPYRYPIRFRNWLICQTLLEGGFRIGELLGMRLEDLLEIDKGGIWIRFRPDNENGSRAKGGHGHNRFVHVPIWLLAQLHFYLTEIRISGYTQSQNQYVWTVLNNHARNHIGTSNFGHPLTATAMSEMFAYYSERSGIRLHPHMLRHTHVNELVQYYIAQGKPIDWRFIQERLGHKSISTTITHYARLGRNDRKWIYERFVEQRDAARQQRDRGSQP